MPLIVNSKNVVEKELSAVVDTLLPEEYALKKITTKLTDSYLSMLETTIKGYRDSFVAKATTIVENDAEAISEPILLPEGTKFYRRTSGTAVFVIEHKPSVRNLYFYESDEVNPKNSFNLKTWRANYRLALPYLVFIPVFKIEKNGPIFSSMCVAYRNDPLKSFNDLLYHPNLPNLGRPNFTSPFDSDKPDGDVNEFAEMVMCLGHEDFYKDVSFNLASTNMPDMVEKLLNHFWSSRYTGELSSMWEKMKNRDPEHYGSLNLWEKASIEDPLFALKSRWVPAIKLDCLIGKIMAYYDNGSHVLSINVADYIGKIHDATWRNLLANCKSEQKDLATAFGKRLEEILKKFSAELAKGLMVINNETIRNTVQFAVAQALRESIKL